MFSILDKIKYPFYHQTSSFDCGITCLKMISKYHGKMLGSKYLSSFFEIENVGVSMSNIAKAAENIGFEVEGLLLNSPDDLSLVPKGNPFIIHWKGNHFVVVYSIKKKHIVIADPSRGIVNVKKEEFFNNVFKRNQKTNQLESFVLVLNPKKSFFEIKSEKSNLDIKIKFVTKQLEGKKIFFIIIFIGLLISMGLQFLTPFITQSVVDLGINSGDLKIVKYFLFGQVILFFISLLVEIIRSWVVINLSSRVNFSMLSEFLKKLKLLPIPFFEIRKTGDFLQRIQDNNRVETFLTRSLINILVSLMSIVIFTFALYIFNKVFFLLFVTSTIIYILWIILFINSRKKIDWERFEVNSQNQTILLQLINGIQDLKIYNSFSFLHKKWEANQVNYIKTSFKSLRLNQIQESGATFIYQIAQTIIIFYAAKLIIDDKLTIGAMLSIQFIIGQLVNPVQQLLSSFIFAIETKLSIDRLFELFDEDEEINYNSGQLPQKCAENIKFNKVIFKHKGQESIQTLSEVTFEITKQKTTAFVGLSGSGKTTVLKLILGYFNGYDGEIKIGETDLKDMNLSKWRDQCGVVLQDNFIFNESIAKNISLQDNFDAERIDKCLKICNIFDYVYSLPNNVNSIIGKEGKGLSQGQKQRIFIARAIYKNPNYLFFDEATNSLDAENEFQIIENLKTAFQDEKTIIFVAHRLSSIKNADKIIVFEDGKVVEEGTHDELIKKEKKYFDLINKQLS